MYEALNARREEAGLPPYRGSGRIHSEEFQQRRWLHANIDATNESDKITFLIDRWEAEPTHMSFLTAEHEHTIQANFLPLTWEIC